MSAAATIDELRLASPPDRWSECGFVVDAGTAVVGQVRLRLGDHGPAGIEAWSLRDTRSTDLDGLPTLASAEPPPPACPHPNGAMRIDHLVVFTPALARTIAAMEAAGLSLRRVREPDEPGPPVRQAFFRLGEVIVEVVEEARSAAGPARFWGLTIRVTDLDACAALLGQRMGEVHAAVQRGRRIATLRREAGLGLPVALISA